MTAAPTDKTTRPGGSRNGSENTEESTSMMSSTKGTALRLTQLPAEPTIPAAPGWATASTPSGEDVSHDYESPVRAQVLTGLIRDGRQEVAHCAVTLSQTDVYRIEDGQVVGTDRRPAEITITTLDDYLRMSLEGAAVLESVLHGLLTRYRVAPSPATPAATGARRCLQGCIEDHPERRRIVPGAPRECTAVGTRTTAQLEFGGPVEVVGRATTYGEDRHADVLLSDVRPDVEGYVEMTTAEARALAAQLIAAADEADALIGGGR